MLADPWFYAAAVPAVILLGLSKGGFTGIAVAAVPLLTLAVGPVQAAGVLLPILIVQDVVSVWAYRRTWSRGIVALMLPAAAVGVGLGWLLAAVVPAAAVEVAVGATAIVFASYRLWAERRGAVPAPPRSTPILGAACGVAAGFTSQIAHAGGPPFQIYVLPKRLPRDEFVGTNALFFAGLNWIKVPAYAALGQLGASTLTAAAVLLPVAVASTFAGVALVRRVPAEGFYRVIHLLLIVVGAVLVWEGAAALSR